MSALDDGDTEAFRVPGAFQPSVGLEITGDSDDAPQALENDEMPVGGHEFADAALGRRQEPAGATSLNESVSSNMPMRSVEAARQVIADEPDEVFPLRLDDGTIEEFSHNPLQVGEHLAVVDAASDFFECEVVRIEGDDVLVRIARHIDAPDDDPVVMFAFGMTDPEVMKRIVMRASEVGVSAFVPLITERSTPFQGDEDDLQAMLADAARHAAMKSGRYAAPEVANPIYLDDLPSMLGGATAILIFWEAGPHTSTLSEAIESGMARCSIGDVRDARIAVVVGPEGGFSPDEIGRLMEAERAALVSLGPTVLTMETAGLLAPALVLYECGALGPRISGWATDEGMMTDTSTDALIESEADAGGIGSTGASPDAPMEL